MDQLFETGYWTLYYHPSREKRWTLDSFEKISTVKTPREVLSIYKELADKLKAGMFFWMRGDIPPLWENFQNIRGGSYSLRGGLENGVDIFHLYTVGAMLGLATLSKDDKIMGVNISPKLVGGGNRDMDQTIGFYTIKIWNADCVKYGKAVGLNLLIKGLTTEEVMYTPHNEKKM